MRANGNTVATAPNSRGALKFSMSCQGCPPARAIRWPFILSFFANLGGSRILVTHFRQQIFSIRSLSDRCGTDGWCRIDAGNTSV